MKNMLKTSSRNVVTFCVSASDLSKAELLYCRIKYGGDNE